MQSASEAINNQNCSFNKALSDYLLADITLEELQNVVHDDDGDDAEQNDRMTVLALRKFMILQLTSTGTVRQFTRSVVLKWFRIEITPGLANLVLFRTVFLALVRLDWPLTQFKQFKMNAVNKILCHSEASLREFLITPTPPGPDVMILLHWSQRMERVQCSE
jgi:hypothetical protein